MEAAAAEGRAAGAEAGVGGDGGGSMAEPLRKRGRRPRGGAAGRGARGSRGGRGRRPRVQGAPARRALDSVLVDLVSDSDEDVLEVPAERGAAGPAEIPPPVPPAPPAPPAPSAAPAPPAPRDDSDTDSDGAGAGGAPRALVRRRRRRLLDPGEAPVVPVYSAKVKNSLHLIPDHLSLLKLCPPEAEEEDTDIANSSSPRSVESPVPESPWKKKLRQEDEDEKDAMFLIPETSPLTSSLPRTKNRKHTQALQKLREVNRRLENLRSCLSPKQRRGQDLLNEEDEVILVEGPTLPENPRLFPLKVRCRADLIRLPVRMSEPLQSVVDHMAARLGVSPSRILLLFGETELSPSATPRSLKLGVADILDCVVLASPPETSDSSQLLQLRVQGKEKHQTLEVSLSSDSPLRTLMCRYEEAMGLSGHKLSFFFDGTKLSGKELPADLGMESGDLIEVWG